MDPENSGPFVDGLELTERQEDRLIRNGTYHIGKTEHCKLEALDVTSCGSVGWQRRDRVNAPTSKDWKVQKKHKNLNPSRLCGKTRARVRSRGPG